MGMRYRRSRGGRNKVSGEPDIGYLLVPVLAVVFFPLAIWYYFELKKTKDYPVLLSGRKATDH